MKELDLQWNYPHEGQLEISVESLRPKLPYRVFLEEQLYEKKITWKLECPSFYSLKMKELGILGYLKGKIDGVPRKIHLPITFSSIPEKISILPYYLFKFVTPSRVDEIFYTLGFLGKDGKSFSIINEDKKIENVISSGNVYQIPIPNSKLATGYYFINFSFQLKPKKSLPCECFFYHFKSE